MIRTRSTHHPNSTTASGFTLIEVAVATAVVGIFVSTLLAATSNMLGILRTANSNIAASQSLQQRVEEMRIANYLQITDSTYIASTLLATQADALIGLTKPVETVTVSPYPAKAGFIPVKVTRESGVTKIITSNSALKDEPAVRVDFNLTWTGIPNKRQRIRETTAIIAKGGISK